MRKGGREKNHFFSVTFVTFKVNVTRTVGYLRQGSYI
jgi:hypothetical protein